MPLPTSKPYTWTPGGGAENKLQKPHCLEASAKFQLILTFTELPLHYNILLATHSHMQLTKSVSCSFVINDIPEVWPLVSAEKKER